MRSNTKIGNLNKQRIKKLSKQDNKGSENSRKKVKDCDLEKAAIIYLHLFRKVENTRKIEYSDFYDTWIKWFPEDSYGCGNIVKQAFNKTVGHAGTTEDSIISYRNTVKIFNMDMVTPNDMKELEELAARKGCTVRTTKSLDKNLSGFCVKKIAPPNYQFRKSNILLGERYSCTFQTAKKYLSNLPDIDDLKSAQEHLKNILITDTTIQEKVNAIHKFPYYVVTYDFELYLNRLVMKCDSWGVLKAALQFGNKVHALSTTNEKPLNVKMNRNATKSLEQLGLFSNDRITKKMINACIRKAEISPDCAEWREEDFKKFTKQLNDNYPQKYQYIRDRYSKMKDYKLWILNKHTGKSYKILEREMKSFLE